MMCMEYYIGKEEKKMGGYRGRELAEPELLGTLAKNFGLVCT